MNQPSVVRGVNAGVWICTLLICAVACATYFPRVALTVQPGDGAELAAAAYNGAIVHPPGYPLYSMCARALVSFFPSNPYYTLSLFSAVLQALTVSLFFQVCFVISSSVFIAGVFASLWMCYGPVVRTATDVEVFALHHFLVTSFTLLMLLYWPSKKRSMLCLLLLGTLGGLASANHHTTILWSPLVLVFLLKNRRHLTRELSLIGIGFGAGLSTYLYLLLPRSSEQLVAFPGITNLRDLWLWIIRDGYGTFSLWSGDGSPTVSYMSHFFITSFSSHWLAWIGVLLLLLGTLRSPSALKLGLGGTTVLHLVFLARIIFPANDPLFEDTAARFYGVITLSMYLSAALAFRSFIAGSRELSCVIALFAFVLALQAIPQELAEGTASRDFILQAELDSILEEVPEQAVFISSTDRISMGIQYQQIVEARRPDVLLLVRGLLGSYAYREGLRSNSELLASIPDQQLADFENVIEMLQHDGRPIYSLSTQKTFGNFMLVPEGIAWRWMQAPPERKELFFEVIRFCSRWPRQLETVSPFRKRSIRNRQMSFGTPIEYLKSQVEDPELNKLLGELLSMLAVGKVEQAASTCQRVLSQVT